MNIVVIEDEVKTRTGLVRLIGKINPEFVVVGEAENGLQGLEVIELLQPDLVIVDINMPQLNGIEMLERLKEKGIRHKTVILSGYSEFEFAKKAIQIGVSEYLLKPITIEDLTHTLNIIQNELLQQKLFGFQERELVKQSGHILQKYLFDRNVAEDTMNTYLYQVMGFNSKDPLVAMSIYLGGNYERLKVTSKDALIACLDSVAGKKWILLELAPFQEMLVVFQMDELNRGLQNDLKVQRFVLEMTKVNQVVSQAKVESISQLADTLQQMRKDRIWSITMGHNGSITTEAIEAITTKLFPYPTELESKAKSVVSSVQPWQVKKYLESFQLLMYKDIYHPRHILESCVRFLSSLLHIAGKVHSQSMSYVDQQQLLNQLMKSQSREEVGDVFEQVGRLLSNTDDSNQTYSLVIHKAIKLIHERYQSGLTLEEMAHTLNLTPEYLSTLFNKEVGKPFTAYMKDFRIKKAIELLLQTDLKTFEIAERIGYPDPKYFNRVFKEATGMAPGEYQKVHK